MAESQAEQQAVGELQQAADNPAAEQAETQPPEEQKATANLPDPTENQPPEEQKATEQPAEQTDTQPSSEEQKETDKPADQTDSQPSEQQKEAEAAKSEETEAAKSEEREAAKPQETEAIEEAKSDLKEKMAEVADNPPTEQPPPPSLNTEEINYEEPMPDPYNKAITYLEQHNILQIFQSMTANIIFQKPDNPLDFMISEVAEMKRIRDSKKSSEKK